MRAYSIGTQYEFIINYFYTTIDDYGRKKMWLSLSDGESERKYNVPAYPYQSSGFEGKTILCKVTKILDSGYLFLAQDRTEVLNHCYQKGETYWFTVGQKLIDTNTRRPYYSLIDRINSIDWHRYYCSEETELEGVVGFVVKSIDQHHLDLELAATKDTSQAQTEALTAEAAANPFGHEDNNHEWKSSLVFSPGEEDQEDPDVEKQIQIILRCIAGFQNAEGGLLYLGVTDDGEVRGIDLDYPYLNRQSDPSTYQQNSDGFENKIRNAVNHFLGKASLDKLDFKFYYQTSSKKVFCIIEARKTEKTIFRNGTEVFKRFGNGFRQLKGDEISDLVLEKTNDTTEQLEFTRPMPKDCIEYNPNTNFTPTTSDATPSVVKLGDDILKRKDYYYMAFFTNNTFLYSKNSHATDQDLLCEVRFNKIDGNLEYSRDLLAKCSRDGHVQFLQAYDVCKLGDADTKISLSTKNILTVKVVHKYDFLKVCFTNGEENREKYLRVTTLFSQDTDSKLRANMSIRDIKNELKNKGNLLVPTGYTVTSLDVVHETLPDEIQFVSPRQGSQGYGSVVGEPAIDTAKY